MTSRYASKLRMYLVVKDYLTTNASIVSALPNYAAYFAAFTGGIDQIQVLDALLSLNNSGLATSKDKLKLNAATLGGDAGRKIKAYARFTKNDLLQSQVDYSDSDLKKTNDTNLPGILQNIYDLAQANLEALTTYGVTAATQTALAKAIADYKNAIPKLRVDTSDGKKALVQLIETFETTDNALGEIKVLIDTLKLQQPAFYNGFKSTMMIIDTPSGSLAVTGVVTDLVTGDPVKGATITFTPEGAAGKGKTNATLVKKSATKGGFNIKTMAPGTYTVTIKKSGYADYTSSIVVSEGELTRITVALTPN